MELSTSVPDTSVGVAHEHHVNSPVIFLEANLALWQETLLKAGYEPFE